MFKMKKLLKIYTDSFKGLSQEAWLLSIVMLINRSGSMVLPFLGVYMVDQLKFSLAQSGFVLSFFGVGALIGSTLGGRLTDKYGSYIVQVMSLAVSVPLYAMLPLFKTVEGLALMMFVLSAVVETFRPANSVAITLFAKPENLTRAFSLNRMAVNLGFSIGPAMGGLLAALSYNFLFFANATSVLLALLLYLKFFTKRRNKYREEAPKKEMKEALESSLTFAKSQKRKKRNPYLDAPFIFFSLFCMLFSVAFFQILNSMPLFYKEGLGYSTTRIGILLAYSGLVIVILEMLVVHIAEKRWTLLQSMLIGTFFTLISFAVIIGNPSMFLVYLGLLFLGIGEILVLPFMSTITALRSDTNSKGRYMGLNGAAISLAFIISPFMGTRLAQDLGFSMLWVITVGILFLTGVGFYFTIKRLRLDSPKR